MLIKNRTLDLYDSNNSFFKSSNLKEEKSMMNTEVNQQNNNEKSYNIISNSQEDINSNNILSFAEKTSLVNKEKEFKNIIDISNRKMEKLRLNFNNINLHDKLIQRKQNLSKSIDLINNINSDIAENYISYYRKEDVFKNVAENKIIPFSFKILKNSYPKIKNIKYKYHHSMDHFKKNNDINFINQRKINPKPYKELIISNLIDDFYLNLLDWSPKDQIAVGCTTSVVLWNNNKTQSEILLNYPCGNLEESENVVEKYVSSLIWSNEGDKLAVGHSLGCVEIYDINKKKLVSNYSGHNGRVGVVSWNGNIISSGSKDCNIITRDIRCKNNNENIIAKFVGHSQEVCGLKWSFDGSQLASGGNDNNLMIWNLHSTKPIMCNNSHLAAVKAIAWSPHQHNILATGGGTADRTIRFWNTSTFKNILKYDTGSQVCNLVFSKTSNELISTHGFSLNQINVWKLPNLQKTATLIGHTFRVLYLGLSPNGQNIVTGAGDQTLKFWNVFPPFKADNYSSLFPSNKDFR